MFLDEVRIPVANRVGAENDGWRVAMVTFSFERGTAFVGELIQSRVLLADLARLARELGRFDEVRRDLGRLDAEFEGLWALTRRTVTQAATGAGAPGLMGSVFKLGYSQARHRLGDLALRVLGPAGVALDDVGDLPSGRHVRGLLHAVSIAIAAGTTQIQRNIVGERLLGLPKER
jgi:alkylation response protein AidB-like acyl-CoA dehydrogenase